MVQKSGRTGELMWRQWYGARGVILSCRITGCRLPSFMKVVLKKIENDI
jgi:hypothetical protein